MNDHRRSDRYLNPVLSAFRSFPSRPSPFSMTTQVQHDAARMHGYSVHPHYFVSFQEQEGYTQVNARIVRRRSPYLFARILPSRHGLRIRPSSEWGCPCRNGCPAEAVYPFGGAWSTISTPPTRRLSVFRKVERLVGRERRRR